MSGPAPDLFAAAARRPTAAPAQAANRAPVDDGRGHVCRVCGDDAGFGFGVFLRRGLEGRWACALHRREVEAMAE